jgi:hypothetical protein
MGRFVIALLLVVCLILVFATPALAEGRPDMGGLEEPPGPPTYSPPYQPSQLQKGLPHAWDVHEWVQTDKNGLAKGWPGWGQIPLEPPGQE